ncbi:iron uptake transporter deferrochelatase/peroxidase subunit [Halobacillus sp. BBL2006]|uniref:iron uptake transporter deferrochelatase/peroxidase subunit n=1 Tax=Halobacillus sp. BBL2006 TaxID=1543706 RepID=UPI000543C04D|nr:iron uptake transporter deferrochelatase/peroxidase subunit [Halobacillus sp. BBL2006]KHE70758.1 deferrochelatase [Halobacillus sp. BBL2006]
MSDQNKPDKITRREMLFRTGAGGLGLLVGASGFGTISALGKTMSKEEEVNSDDVIPFYGKHQAGITTKQQTYVYLIALDLTTEKLSDIRDLFKEWTIASEKMSKGVLIDSYSDNLYVPPADTGEAAGLSASNLTLTYGFGPTFFEKEGADRFGLASKRPQRLKKLPAFPGDQLEDAWTGGDLCVQVCADDQQVAFHAIRNLIRIGRGIVTLRWMQSGFLRSPKADKKNATPRNLFGFKDGTVNPSTNEDYNDVIWSNGSEASWMKNGSYMVMRRIRMLLEVWDRTHLNEQNKTFGREKVSGAPLGHKDEFDEIDFDKKDEQGKPYIPADSHVKLGRGDGSQKIHRRSYSYSSEMDPTRAQLDAGLLFMSYQKDPFKQFVPIQKRMASSDRMNEYIRHIGSAVFACPGGISEGGYIGDSLF